jgi:hypothetical protein
VDWVKWGSIFPRLTGDIIWLFWDPKGFLPAQFFPAAKLFTIGTTVHLSCSEISTLIFRMRSEHFRDWAQAHFGLVRGPISHRPDSLAIAPFLKRESPIE